MAEIIYESDADLSVIQDRHVAVVGYDALGQSHALSLRDSGVQVCVGLPDDSPLRQAATYEGLAVYPVADAIEEADVIVLPADENQQREVYEQQVAEHLVAGDTLMVPTAFNIRYGLLQPPAGVDVALVAPTQGGEVARSEYADGRGTAVFVAVHADHNGGAWPLTLAYAKAIGGLRAGAITTTFAEQCDARLLAQQVVAHGAVPELVTQTFETLLATGCSAEVAYFECVAQLRAAAARIAAHGIADQRRSAGGLGEFAAHTAAGSFVDEQYQQRIRQAMQHIHDGTFARQYVTYQETGPDTDDIAAASKNIDEVGEYMRPLLRRRAGR